MAAAAQTLRRTVPALPRGPHRLAREEVLASQRGRMLDAMAEAVAAKGYVATTVADVVSRAGVSRKTFYEHFAGKEDCFLAAYDAAAELVMATIEGSREESEDWLGRIEAGNRAFLEVLAAEPAFARSFFVDVLAAGPRALERRAVLHRVFSDYMRARHDEARAEVPGLPDVPDQIFDALVGAIDELVSQYVRDERTAQLPELFPTVMYLSLALIAGHETAEARLRGVPA